MQIRLTKTEVAGRKINLWQAGDKTRIYLDMGKRGKTAYFDVVADKFETTVTKSLRDSIFGDDVETDFRNAFEVVEDETAKAEPVKPASEFGDIIEREERFLVANNLNSPAAKEIADQYYNGQILDEEKAAAAEMISAMTADPRFAALAESEQKLRLNVLAKLKSGEKLSGHLEVIILIYAVAAARRQRGE